MPAAQALQLLPDGRLGGNNPLAIAGGWRNPIAERYWQPTGIPIHRIWNDSTPWWDGHPAKDCTHYCVPGGYNMWAWSLWRLLLQLKDGGGLPTVA